MPSQQNSRNQWGRGSMSQQNFWNQEGAGQATQQGTGSGLGLLCTECRPHHTGRRARALLTPTTRGTSSGLVLSYLDQIYVGCEMHRKGEERANAHLRLLHACDTQGTKGPRACVVFYVNYQNDSLTKHVFSGRKRQRRCQSLVQRAPTTTGTTPTDQGKQRSPLLVS